MNLKQLEAFVMIADNKSFSLTAEKLYLTQPTVSAYISKLESELGEKLFYRTTKEVALTEAGKKIYIYAKDIIELAEKIENAFKESPEEGPRRMVISASSIPGTYLLPGILAEFSSAFPNVELRVQETDSVGVMNDIREHRADLGFVGTAVKDREISFLPFCMDELVLVTQNNDRYRKLMETDRGSCGRTARELTRRLSACSRRWGSAAISCTFSPVSAIRARSCFLSRRAAESLSFRVLQQSHKPVGEIFWSIRWGLTAATARFILPRAVRPR